MHHRFLVGLRFSKTVFILDFLSCEQTAFHNSPAKNYQPNDMFIISKLTRKKARPTTLALERIISFYKIFFIILTSMLERVNTTSHWKFETSTQGIQTLGKFFRHICKICWWHNYKWQREPYNYHQEKSLWLFLNIIENCESQKHTSWVGGFSTEPLSQAI